MSLGQLRGRSIHCKIGTAERENLMHQEIKRNIGREKVEETEISRDTMDPHRRAVSYSCLYIVNDRIKPLCGSSPHKL